MPERDARAIKAALERLQQEPRTRGTVKLENAPFAQFRHRVGNYRILFDVDEERKVVEVVDIRRRSERTYR